MQSRTRQKTTLASIWIDLAPGWQSCAWPHHQCSVEQTSSATVTAFCYQTLNAWAEPLSFGWWLGDAGSCAPVVTGGNITMLSFLEVLESTCSSLGSKAKHLNVKASGNALKAQMHTQHFYQQQHWDVQQCLYPTQAVAKLTANKMEAIVVLQAVKARCTVISMDGLQCHHDHAV